MPEGSFSSLETSCLPVRNITYTDNRPAKTREACLPHFSRKPGWTKGDDVDVSHTYHFGDRFRAVSRRDHYCDRPAEKRGQIHLENGRTRLSQVQQQRLPTSRAVVEVRSQVVRTSLLSSSQTLQPQRFFQQLILSPKIRAARLV
jgi:hypothetical protein